MAVARTVPVVVLLDDLQWADPSSLDLFQHLARQMRAAPVLLGGTYRDVEVDLQHPLQSALLDLDRQQLVDWIELGRLSRQDTAEIARTVLGRQEVPDALVEQLYRRTEGNPFFVHELLRASGEAGEPTADLGHVAVPDRIRAFVGRRVAQLGANAQEVLRQASVLGSQFGFQALKAVSGRLEDELEATLEAAIRAGLVREIGVDEYAFTQPLTRQALYEELPGRRRRRLHRIAAEALERSRPPIGEAGIGREPQQDGRAAELAWHFLQADEADRALHYALLAGDQAEAVFAHRDAEQHYRTALDLVPRASEAGDGTEAKVLEKLGRVLRVVGRYPDALESLERAAQLHGEASDADGERRVAAQIGPLLAQMGRPAEGLARLQPILDSASEGAPGASQSLALLYVAYAQLLSANRRFNAAVQASERAEALARQLRDESVRAGALVRRGEALGMLGRYEESRQVLEEAVALGEAADLGTLIQALVGVGTTSTFAGQLEESRGYHERALQLAERLQDPRSIATCQTALGEIFFCLGDWMQARRLFEQAGQNLDRLDLDHLAARLRITLAYLTALEGKPAEGRPQVHEALEVVERSRDPRGIWRAHAVLAEIDLLERRYAEALLTLGQVAEPTDLYARDRTHFLLLQARARTGAGDEHTAETAVTEAITRASATHDRLSFVQALAIRGSLRTIQRRWDEAERLFEGALSVTQAMPFPHQAGRILCGFGMMEARRSRVQAAEHRLREALAIFERLGAALEADRTRRILASLKAI
jgi:tetratricopeptide (TPR) repeat protein